MPQNAMSIAQTFVLPYGLKLSNRIIKASMEKMLGSDDNQPNEYIYRLDERWATASFGIILTVNVQIDERYPGFMTDIMIPTKDKIDINIRKWYAHACQSHRTSGIIQINHVGRQSSVGKGSFRERPIASSPAPLCISDNIFARTAQRLVIGTPH